VTKRLIVNGDDLGYSENRNRGIIEAYQRGILTSASLLANGDAFLHAVNAVRDLPDLDIGLHLNLSEGQPLVDGHTTIVDDEGFFFGKDESRRRALEGKFAPREVERETRAQIQRLQDAGLPLTRVDGHHHIHVYGNVGESIARAAQQMSLRWTRLPIDWREGNAKAEGYSAKAREFAGTIARFGLRAPDHFFGVALSGCLSVERLESWLRELPEGVTEFMVHPGYADEEDGFSGEDREGELRVLTDSRVRAILHEEEIELISFRDLK